MTYKEAYREAEKMKNENPIMSNWGTQTLAIWIRDRFKCIYCEENMVQSALVMDHVSSLDHLLPKKHHPHLVSEPWNLVLACRRCNNLKRAWDAVKEAKIANPKESDREVLLAAAKNRVLAKKASLDERYEKQKAILQTLIAFAIIVYNLFHYPVFAQDSTTKSLKKQNAKAAPPPTDIPLLKTEKKQSKKVVRQSKSTNNTELENLRREVERQRRELDELKQREKDSYPDESEGKTLIWNNSCSCWVNRDNPNEKFVWESSHHRYVKKR